MNKLIILKTWIDFWLKTNLKIIEIWKKLKIFIELWEYPRFYLM